MAGGGAYSSPACGLLRHSHFSNRRAIPSPACWGRWRGAPDGCGPPLRTKSGCPNVAANLQTFHRRLLHLSWRHLPHREAFIDGFLLSTPHPALRATFPALRRRGDSPAAATRPRNDLLRRLTAGAPYFRPCLPFSRRFGGGRGVRISMSVGIMFLICPVGKGIFHGRPPAIAEGIAKQRASTDAAEGAGGAASVCWNRVLRGPSGAPYTKVRVVLSCP